MTSIIPIENGNNLKKVIHGGKLKQGSSLEVKSIPEDISDKAGEMGVTLDDYFDFDLETQKQYQQNLI